MGHVFSVLLERSLDDIQFPYVCLTVSGGHNDIYVVEEQRTKSVEQERDCHAE
jgi:tRNA A37 threonylcarbamoyltransferase TsaD